MDQPERVMGSFGSTESTSESKIRRREDPTKGLKVSSNLISSCTVFPCSISKQLLGFFSLVEILQ